MRRPAPLLTLLLGLALLAPWAPARAAEDPPAPVVSSERVAMSDGVTLATTLTSAAPDQPRPVVVEFSPYGRNSHSFRPSGDYQSLLVQIRGTGDSDGSFDALGPRTQQDVVDTMRWACDQPWSNGRLALVGFSASAITVYNSLHHELPCLETMVLKSGTFELYRDLLWPGGVSNLLPGVGVLAMIGAPALAQGLDRLARNPLSAVGVLSGLTGSGLSAGVTRSTLDEWWRERGFRGDANRVPVLVVNGFFDVESRGAFQGFQQFAPYGGHLLVTGAHDGSPAGTDGGLAEQHAWLDHHLRDLDNGVDAQPAVQGWLPQGSRQAYLGGEYADFSSDAWPLTGTTWESLHLTPERSGTAISLHDGSLALEPATTRTRATYPTVPTLPMATDVPTWALLDAAAGGQGSALPIVTDLRLAELTGITFTTPALREPVRSIGPLSLELPLSTTTRGTAIWAVLSDVAPDGTASPLTVGRLHTDFPDVVRSRSLVRGGEVVQPYGDFSTPTPPRSGETRRYSVELWPVGNEFRAGHRIRLDIVGASAASRPGLPGLHRVGLGGADGARLLFPVAPGSDLGAALR